MNGSSRSNAPFATIRLGIGWQPSARSPYLLPELFTGSIEMARLSGAAVSWMSTSDLRPGLVVRLRHPRTA